MYLTYHEEMRLLKAEKLKWRITNKAWSTFKRFVVRVAFRLSPYIQFDVFVEMLFLFGKKRMTILGLLHKSLN